MAIAKRCGIRNMDVHIGLQANRLVQCHHAAHHVLVARRALCVKLNDERLTTTLNAGKLLFQSALALIDRGKMRSSAGDFPISRDGLLAQAIGRQTRLLRGFRGSSTRIGSGHHAALSFIRCLGCTGHALSGVVNLCSEFSDARLQFSQAHRVRSGLFAHFTQPSTSQLHALGSLLLRAERLNAALLQRALCVLRCLADAFHFITSVFKERNGAGQLLTVALQTCQLAREAGKLLAVLVVQVKCHCLPQFTTPQIKRLEATCLLCLTLHNA